MRHPANLIRETAFGLIVAASAIVVIMAMIALAASLADRPTCVERVNRDPEICSELGGVLDSHPDGATVCVFGATVPP